MKNKTADGLKITLVYALALAGGYYTLQQFSTGYALFDLFQADLAATVIVFGGSVMLKNTSTYDAYWSVAPIAFIPFWMMHSEAITLRMVLLSTVIIIWGVRLTYNWYRGWTGLDHEDWRYVDMRQKTGYFYPFVNLLGLHLFPTLLVFVGCMPMEMAFINAAPIHAFDVLAFLIGMTGIYFEWRADKELHAFKQNKKGDQDILTTGLWAKCRHPNYLGEILIWVSMFFFGIAAGGSVWPLILGPGLMIGLFVGVSIPMIDKRMLAKRPHYAEVMKKTPALLPIGSRKKA